jgi:hypothetical protein
MAMSVRILLLYVLRQAMQQIREKVDMIDLDKDTINAEVLDLLGIMMDNLGNIQQPGSFSTSFNSEV